MIENSKNSYSVGIYARLSVDTEDRKNESIDTQLEIARAFVEKQKNMFIYKCYIDLGKTGINFKREGFERMMNDVRMHKINCIIVKDLSRFGRNHIETGNYIERIFPFMGVRFIAVTDNFDSMKVSGKKDILGVNLKNLINEMYAGDISVKVRTGKQAKWEQGSYTGGLPPYGYKAEWIADKKCLIVDKRTSDIVKNIFMLFVSGKSIKEIVLWLYENNVVSPAEYHRTGNIYCYNSNLRQWSKGSVKVILTNPVYMGCLVHGRTAGFNMESGDIKIKEHTHEAVISKDMFFNAAKRFEKNSLKYRKASYTETVPLDEDIFKDIIFCGDCGSKMKRISAIKELSTKHKKRIYSYNCPNKDRVDGLRCVSKNISLHSLTNIVKEAIKKELSLSDISTDNLEFQRSKEKSNKQMEVIEKQIERLKRLQSEQYVKYRIGEIDMDSFKRLKEDNDKKIVLYRRKSADLMNQSKCSNNTEMTKELVRTLISRIEVYKGQRLEIIFAGKRNNTLL